MNAFRILILVLSCIAFQIVAGNSKVLENAMRDNSVIPDVVANAPKHLLNVTYSNGVKVNMGNELSVNQTHKAPVNVSWPYESGSLYALFMVDPDAPNRQRPVKGQWLHWLIVNITKNTLSSGKVMMSYNGPNPPTGSGLHRYVLLVYKQKPNSKANRRRISFSSINNRSKFNVTEYAKANNLTELIAANFFQAKRN